jgi:tetratricopeptide (TPR) repeat protein
LSGDLPQALALTEQALALQKASDDQFGASVTLTNLLATLYELGAYDRLLALADEALALKEKLGDRHGAAIVRDQHGLAAYALASAQVVGAAAEAAYAQHDLGALLLRLNDHTAAIPLLEAARAKWRELGNDLLRLKSEAYLGLARLKNDEPSTARELAEENWQAFQRGGLSGEQPQSWLWTLYQLLDRLNQPERAAAVLRAAFTELQRQGAAISDDHLRR